MGQSILITGGAGFLGAHIARALVERGERVVIYDNFFTGLPQNLHGFGDRIKLVNGDILDLSYLIRTVLKEKVNRIIHTAALVGYLVSIDKPALIAKINIEGTINVLETSRIADINRIVDISSEEVYGHFQYEPADEDHPFSPTTPYPITKMAAERYDEFFRRFFGLDVLIIRTSWVYGPGLPRARPPKIFIENGLKGVGTKMGSGADHRADHTYIDDFVQGVLLALDIKNPQNCVFNIASGKGYSLKEMAEMIEEIVPGTKITMGAGLLKYSEGMEDRLPQKGALSIERAKSELSYQPKYDLFEGLTKYADYLRTTSGG